MIDSKTQNSEQHSVLFICAANQCRSVMAEYALKSMVKSHSSHPEAWRIESAGVHAFNGMNATPFAVRAVEDIQEDASHHVSRIFTCDLGANFALILCMQKYHQSLIQNACPAISDRVYLVSEMEEKADEIVDPVGMSLTTYKETMNLLLSIFKQGWSYMEKLSSLHN